VLVSIGMVVKMNKLKIYSIIVTIILLVCLIYFVGINMIKSYCDECRTKGIQGSLQALVNEIKNRGTAIQVTVGNDSLICDLRK